MAERGNDGAYSGEEQLEESETRNRGSRRPDPVQQVPGDDSSGNGTIANPVLPCNREKCRYGEQCYRKNAGHKRQFSHPGDPDYYDVAADKMECPYGLRCYRKNPLHRMRYKHTQEKYSRRNRNAAATRTDSFPDTDESSDAEESVDESEYEPETDDQDRTTEDEQADSEESCDENV